MENNIVEIKTPFHDGKVKIVKRNYAVGGRILLALIDASDGEPLFTATVNLPDETLEDGYVFLKGYSENEGLPEALEKAGVVAFTGRVVKTGFVTVKEAKLLV
jgi:hypothetical protein